MCKARALLDCELPRRERPLLAGKHLTATHCLCTHTSVARRLNLAHNRVRKL